jgi:hypothetical protein
VSVTREELIEFLNEAEQRGDMETANAVLDKIEAMGQTDQPIDYGEPVVKDGQFQVGGPAKPLDIAEDIIAPVVEPGLATASGMAAYIPAQIAGGIQRYANPNQPLAGPEARDRVQAALTYAPRAKRSKQIMERYKNILQPVADLEEKARLGDEALSAGAPPWLARNAEAIPEMAEMLLAALPTPNIPKSIKKGILKASPTLDRLRSSADKLFKQVDDMGVTIKETAYTGLIDDLYKEMTKKGLDQQVTPKSYGVIERLYSEGGKPMTLSDIETMREVAKGAAASLDKRDAMLGTIAVHKIDEFLESLTPKQMMTGKANANKVGVTYREARNQWGRYRRAEMVDQAVEVASVARSGWENGIRQEMTNLLKRIKKGKEKGFKPHEIVAIEKVANGTLGANVFRELGKMGVGYGQMGNNWLGAFLTGSAAYTLGGPAAAISAVGAGTAFKKLAEILTRANAGQASALIRAGKDAQKITKAYYNMVPKAARSADELSLLLLHSDIDLSDFRPPKGIERQAVDLAIERKARLTAILAAQNAESGQTQDWGAPVVKDGQFQIGGRIE